MITELLAITPKLRVTMENTSGKKLEVMHFESDACFAHFEKALTPFEVHVFADVSRIFRLPGGFTFELVDHEYDGLMRLNYFGRLDGP